MANYVYIATSLDGFIADSNGGLDWLLQISNPDKSDFGFGDFMSGIDAIVMGRKTYETVLTFGEWPYTKPVFVLSNTMNELPERLNGFAKIVKGGLKAIIAGLQEQGYNNLYVDGGLTIQSFLKEDLIDELIITRIPVLLGGGISLFGDLAKSLSFRHIKTEVMIGALVKSFYVRERNVLSL